MFLLCARTNCENKAFRIFFENFFLDFDLNQKIFLIFAIENNVRNS